MGLYKYVVRVRVWGIFMNDKNIFIGVCEDNSLHLNLVKGYIDDFFNEFHNYEVLEFVSGEDLLSNYPNNIETRASSDEEEIILDYIRKNDRLTKNQAAELLEVSASTATRLLKRMVENHVLKRNGKARNTYYTELK